MTELNWKALLELKCPKCYNDLEKEGPFYHCLCDYLITTARMKEIIDEMFDEDKITKQDKLDFDELLEADR